MSENVTNLTQETFKSFVTSSELPVLVDFWAPWCGPCKSLAPIIDEIADTFEGVFKVAKVNIDDNEDLASAMVGTTIRAIPTVLLIKGNKVINQYIGLMPKATLVGKIKADLERI